MSPPKPCHECPSAADIDLLYWQAAITDWHETGSKTAIEEGLRAGRPIPPFARGFLADLISGKATRQPERKRADLARRNHFIRGHYETFLKDWRKAKREGRLLDDQLPSDLAKQELAAIYNLSFEGIRAILKKKKG